VLAPPTKLNAWRQALTQAAEEYHRQLLIGDATEQEAAQLGLEVIRKRLRAIDARLYKPESL
ncbi:MAG: hypothetical protein N2439_01220, partial [Anaerolineae bacterium]|nr:hypothetical protein [Anaerolineae bacterium]